MGLSVYGLSADWTELGGEPLLQVSVTERRPGRDPVAAQIAWRDSRGWPTVARVEVPGAAPRSVSVGVAGDGSAGGDAER